VPAAGDLGLRAAIVAVALVLWFRTQKALGARVAPLEGIGDRAHEWSAPLHAWLASHPRAADRTLIVSSAFVDAFGLYLVGATLLGPTLRPFLALGTLFALRQACQAVCSLPVPRGSIWRDPGFPSLFVTYGTSTDFFFSGHTAIAVLGALELSRSHSPWLTSAAAAVAFLEAATVLVLRAHYTMDVFTAPFVAAGCERFAAWAAPTVDAWLRGHS
jgi:hypothetical protein